MPKLNNMLALPVKDQIIICVTDALAQTNRHLEPIPRFSRRGKLIHIECSSKDHSQIYPFKLVIHYNEYGNVSSIGDRISVDTDLGEINYERVHAELLKIFRAWLLPHTSSERAVRLK